MNAPVRFRSSPLGQFSLEFSIGGRRDRCRARLSSRDNAGPLGNLKSAHCAADEWSMAWKAFWWLVVIGVVVALWQVAPPLAILAAITLRAVLWANWVGKE